MDKEQFDRELATAQRDLSRLKRLATEFFATRDAKALADYGLMGTRGKERKAKDAAAFQAFTKHEAATFNLRKALGL
jgi:hypothetical protein